jgi:hypothetical protein
MGRPYPKKKKKTRKKRTEGRREGIKERGREGGRKKGRKREREKVIRARDIAQWHSACLSSTGSNPGFVPQHWK